MSATDSTWRARGACQGLDAEIFYPEDDEDFAEDAKAVCAECAVRLACLNHALDNPSTKVSGVAQPPVSAVGCFASVAARPDER
jgi:hypothetical protein